jgi:molybdopterin/thiamine biosynthesis adenylyltransferase
MQTCIKVPAGGRVRGPPGLEGSSNASRGRRSAPRAPQKRIISDEGFPETNITLVIGVATGMVGIAMASAAILNLTGTGDPMPGHRLIYDLAFPGMTKVLVRKNLHCSICGRRR